MVGVEDITTVAAADSSLIRFYYFVRLKLTSWTSGSPDLGNNQFLRSISNRKSNLEIVDMLSNDINETQKR